MARPVSDTEGDEAQTPERGLVEVVVVDDHRTFADAMSLAIETVPDLRCVATVSTAEAAIELVGHRCVDVVLLDLALPGMSGIEAIGELKARCPDVRVIVLTATTTAESLLAAAEAGADGFLPKEQQFADVVAAIRDSDESLVADRRTLARLLRHAGSPGMAAPPRPPVDLTDRELEILVLLADGVPVKRVASRLGISVNTCRGHVRALLGKFDAHSQLAAVVKAARAGLVPNLRVSGG